MVTNTTLYLALLAGMLFLVGVVVAWVILDKKGYKKKKKKLFDSIRNATEETIQTSIFTPLYKLKDCTGFSSERGKLIWAEAVRIANDTMDNIYISKFQNITDIEELQNFIENIYDINLVYLHQVYKLKNGLEEKVEVFPKWIEETKEKFIDLALRSKNAEVIAACLPILPRESEEYKSVCAYCEILLSDQVTKLLKDKPINIEGFCKIARAAKTDSFIKFLNECLINAVKSEVEFLKNKEALYFFGEVIKKIKGRVGLDGAFKYIQGEKEEIIVNLYEVKTDSTIEDLVAVLKQFTSSKAVFYFLSKVEAVAAETKHELFSKVYLQK